MADNAIISLRKTILICSAIYYGAPGIPEDAQSPYSDAMYDNWARTLKTLQGHNLQPQGFYDEHFKDWGANNNFSGLHLPRDEFVVKEAIKLLEEYK